MRRKHPAVLLILLLLLSACGSAGDENRVAAFRDALEQSAVTCEAEVTAVWEDAQESFTLSCTETADGAQIAVLAPKLLSGVTAEISGKDAALSFDGLVVPTPLRPGGVSALAALPTVITALRTGHLDLVWREGDALAAQLILRDDLAVRVFFTAEDVPAYAELILNGETAARCVITQWNSSAKEDLNESHDSNLGGDQSQDPGA